MAVTAARVTVNTTAVALNTASTSGQTLVVKNGATAVDLGPSTVTSGNGFSLTSATVAVDLDPGDILYAICGTSSVVEVLRT